jgi:enterochelin esterase-like enzyme
MELKYRMRITAVMTCMVTVPLPAVLQSAQSRVVVETLSSTIFDNTRSIRVYLPAAYDDDQTARYPVLYLNDGFAVFSSRGWNAPATLDRLIQAGRIPPIIVVGIDNAASIPGARTPVLDRAREYLPYTDVLEPELKEPEGLLYPSFLLDEVVPFVSQRFRTSERPSERAIGGSSYGAIAALVTVFQRPGAFGGLMLESAPLFLSDGRLLDDAKKLTIWPDSLYMAVGTAETADVTVLKRGEAAFEAFGQVVKSSAPKTRLSQHIEAGAEHSSAAWAARFPVALEHLFAATR